MYLTTMSLFSSKAPMYKIFTCCTFFKKNLIKETTALQRAGINFMCAFCFSAVCRYILLFLIINDKIIGYLYQILKVCLFQ